MLNSLAKSSASKAKESTSKATRGVLEVNDFNACCKYGRE
jgi:hypothetical protein